MGDLSAHFSSGEFADHRTGHLVRPPVELLNVLEAIRAIHQRPLRILSGHRCCSTNEAVGGALRSRHVAGDAADIPPGVVSLRGAWAAGAVGVGVKGDWAVHVDVRPGPRTTWTY